MMKDGMILIYGIVLTIIHCKMYCTLNQDIWQNSKPIYVNFKKSQEEKRQKFVVKLILLGDCQVGKSSLVMRFVKNEFDQYKFPTIGATFLTQSCKVGAYEVKYEIWDTAGQEKYRSIAPLYYRGASCALVVYEIGSEESYENATKWIDEVRTIEGDHVLIALAGNKVDLAGRKVMKDDAYEYAKRNNFIFYETSAKTSQNVKELFRSVAVEMTRRYENGELFNKRSKPGIVVENEEQKKKSCCQLL
eukprot:215046_1